MDAVGTAEAGATIFDRELDLEHLMTTAVERRRPTRARLPSRADRLLLFPIDDKLADIESLLGIRLPLDIDGCRTNDLDPKTLLTVYQHLRGHVSGIEEMLLWGEVCLMKLSLDNFSHRFVSMREQESSRHG